jgi:hypothetical protein
MKESYGEGLASRAGSESCGHGRKAGYEAYDHHVPFGRESVIRVRETVQSIDKITNLRSSKVARARFNKSLDNATGEYTHWLVSEDSPAEGLMTWHGGC